MAKKETQVPCPYCGALIDRNAKACPECGSDENTGWSDKTYLDGIDLEDGDDYDTLVEKEFGCPKRRSQTISWKAVVGILILAAFVLLLLGGLW